MQLFIPRYSTHWLLWFQYSTNPKASHLIYSLSKCKKMIGNQLIRRVDVYRGYQLNITFNFDLTPYIEWDDAAAC